MTKVIMNGCNGKMGQTITEICKADADIEIVAGIDLYDGIDNDYPVFSSIDKCDVAACDAHHTAFIIVITTGFIT